MRLAGACKLLSKNCAGLKSASNRFVIRYQNDFLFSSCFRPFCFFSSSRYASTVVFPLVFNCSGRRRKIIILLVWLILWRRCCSCSCRWCRLVSQHRCWQRTRNKCQIKFTSSESQNSFCSNSRGLPKGIRNPHYLALLI